MTQTSSNKRIAKNTLMLYIRMLLSTVVSLYTSRVVLEVLGVEDYGIYGIVGGVVAMFSFLNASMAGATSRFLTYEMGKGDEQRLRDTFSSALMIHIGIAVVVFILAETVGLWFLNNKLVIPEARMGAAHWVYQLSIWGMVVSVTQVPYNASIIAHEKMAIYAYIELAHVLLKLGIVYLLTIGNFDKLILYAALVLAVNVLIALVYRLYCVKHYEESHFSLTYDKQIMKSMFGFSIWEVLGHFGFTFRTQGVNVVLNMFFGVALNAVTNIATTVQNVLLTFSNNVQIAIKPQIVKRYALGKFEDMLSLIMSGIRINLLLQLIITLPLIFCMDFILELWLKTPPADCATFCRIMLCSNLVSSISQIVYSGIQATGRLQATSICRNILYIGTPILLYILFKLSDFPPEIAFVAVLCSQIVLATTDTIILKKMIPCFNLKDLLLIVLKSSIIVYIIVLLNLYLLKFDYSQVLEFVLVTLSSIVILLLSFYCWVFSSTERQAINKILGKFKKITIC